MPIFDNNGKKQNVQDAHIEKYMELYPDATTVMERDGKKYRVKAKDYNTFLGDTLQAPKMESAPQPAPQVEAEPQQGFFTGVKAQIADTAKQTIQKPRGGENGYTFTAEELGIDERNGDVTPKVEQPQEKAWWQTEVNAPKAESPYSVNPVEFQGQVDQEEKAIAARLPQANAAMSQRMQQGQTVQGAFDRAYSDYRVNYPAIEAEELTSGLLDEYSKERASRQSQVEKDVENYSSARKWALNPYNHGNDAYGEMRYRSGATKLRKADELGMMEEFAEDAKSRILSDEGLKAKAEENAKALDMPVEKYVNEVAVPILQEKMYRQWLSPREEQMKKNYNGVIAAAEGSLIGTLLGATRTDTEKYLSQVGQEAWRENASLLGRAAAGAGSMFLDLPAFGGIGALASVPARALGGQVFKQLAKNETKRLVARGVAEGAAQRYANYAVRNGLKNRILLNLSTAPLQSGLTFGMFDAGKAALNMSLNGEWDWKELGKSALGGALMGGALGATGAVGGGLTHGLTGATKAAAKVAEFGVENAVFTEGGRLIGKLHGQQPENGWLEDYVESGATLLMIKAPNIVKNVSRIKGDKEASEVFAFNRLEREQLGKYGNDLNAVLEDMLPRAEVSLTGKTKVALKGDTKVSEEALTEQYVRVMSDTEVPLVTKAKLMGIVEGKVMSVPRVVTATAEGDVVKTYDALGRLVEAKEFANGKMAEAAVEKMQPEMDKNSVSVLEELYVRARGYEADNATVMEWLAQNPDVKAEDIAKIVAKNNTGEKLTEVEQRILDSLRKARREGLNDVRYLNDVLAELEAMGFDAKDVKSGIEKPVNKRTEAENKAVNAYRNLLFREVEAKVGVKGAMEREQMKKDAGDVNNAAENVRKSQEGAKLLADRIQESDRQVDETANDGMVYTTTNNNGEKIIITGGKVVLDNEGYIDVNQSEGLVALMPDGTKKPVRVDELREKVEVSNAEELKAVRRTEIKQEVSAEPIAESGEVAKNEVLTYEEGGETHSIEVLGDNGDGTSRIINDGQEEIIGNDLLESLRGTQEVVEAQKGENVTEGVESVGETDTLPKEKQAPAPIPMEKRGKEERAAYHLVPIERTMEDLHDGALEPDEIVGLIDARIKEAESDVKAVEKKKPVIGADKNAYVAAKQQWQADMEAAKAKLDYYNQLKAINVEATRSEMREAVETVKPRDVVEKTADEFVASVMPKITPESFKKETGLKNSEQKALVGVIAGEGNGGVTIEQAAEIVLENYEDELRGLGFNGDVQDVRDMIIDILSTGNPRSYAKKGLEMRQQADVEQQKQELEGIAVGMNFKDTKEMIGYEEAVVPRIIQDYTGFDETEYFNNLAENIKYDTTREGESTRGSSELLQGKQPADNAGVADLGEPGQGGEVQGDVYSGGENAAPQGNQQVSGSEIPNNLNRDNVSPVEGAAEGEVRTESGEVKTENAPSETDAPGQSGVSKPQATNEMQPVQETIDQTAVEVAQETQNMEPVATEPINEAESVSEVIGGVEVNYIPLPSGDVDIETLEKLRDENIQLLSEAAKEFAEKNGVTEYEANQFVRIAVDPDKRLGERKSLQINKANTATQFLEEFENGYRKTIVVEGGYIAEAYANGEKIQNSINLRTEDADVEAFLKRMMAENIQQKGIESAEVQSVETEGSASSKMEKRINNNLAAIETVKQLLESGKEPNDAQREVISKFDGWAGLEDRHDEIVQRLKSILSDANEHTVATLGNEHVFDGLEDAMKRVAESEKKAPQEETVTSQGIVNTETLQPTMSESDFAELVKGDDIEAMRAYLKEVEDALRIDDAGPLAGEMALREEYRRAVEQYGKENIPAEVMQSLNERMKPYAELSRELFDRKYALQDRVRELESAAEKATAAKEKQKKVEDKNAAFGGFLADKTDLAASTAEKALSKKYNFDGKVMTVAEFVEDAVGRGDVKLSTIEEPKYKGASRAAWNRMDARQQEADAKRVKESGTKTVYTVNDHNFGKNAYDYAKFLLDKKAEQEKAAAKQKVKDAIEPFAKKKAAEQAPIKIEDVGEKIGGARKDVIRKYADKIKLDGKTFGTMFPKPEIDQLVEAGLPLDRVAAVKAMFDNAKREYERTKKRMGKDKALSASLFYAMYAKNVLNGETDNFDLKYNGWVFTDWGKEYMKANIALYRAVFEKLGAEYGKMDLAKYAITPLDAQHKKMLNLKALNESNAKMQALRAKEKGEEPPVYKDGDLINFVGENHARPSDQFETLEEAVNAMVERIGKEVKPGAEALYKPEVYWKTDERGRADYSKTFVGVKVRGFGTVDLMEFKSSNEARQWLDEHGDDFQQMAAAKEVQVKAENKKPLPKYSIEYTLDRVNSQYAVVANFGKGKVHTLRTFDFPEDDARARMSVFKDEVMPFLNSQEAVQAANEYAEELQQKKSAPKNVVVEKNSRERVGVDWRNGQDATTEMFVDVEGKEPSVFGFRALEFGNYVSQKERQQYLNDIYDALMDMSEVLGVSPRALSLGGKLALAVGARGTSGASGHYEPYKNVINITKTKGAGVLAHEWLHALDRYFSNFDENALYPNGVRYATGKEYAENTRQEIKDAFEKIMSAVRGGEYQKRSARLGDYWASDKELAARALQDYMMRKLDERGQKNDFLSNHLAPEDWAGDMNNYPFPLGAEADRIAEAFDNFFATVEEKTEDGQTVLFQQGMIELDRENPAFERATENVRKKLEATGVKVNVLTKEEAESELARLEELADMQKRTAPETASVQDEHQPTVVSSADGAKVLKDLDNAIKEYENKSSYPKTLLGDVAKVLNAKKHGSNSQYATFEAVNGKVFTIRLANHNAKISTFDNHDESEGISIVVTAQDNNGVTNDGNAHLVEFFYDAIKLRKADGKPLVEILKSIKQALYSGEYKDNTGLAQAEEVNIPMFLRTSDGTTYGWAVNGEIYLTPEGLNPNTPIHEYTHLWAAALQKSNPKLWSEVVEAMKLSPAWNEVMADENYTDIHGDDNRVASEVLSRLSGNEGYRRYMEQAEAEIAAERNIGEKVRKKGILNRIKNAVSRFWNWLKGKLGSKAKAGDGTEAKAEPWDVFVNKTLKDFDEGVNPDVKESSLEKMFMGEKGAENLDKAKEATTRLDNLNVAREMETAGKEAKAIKLATGWERGADGKWRYETEDAKVNRGAELFSLETYKSYPIAGSIEIGRVDENSTIKLTSLVKDDELFKAYPEMEEYYVSFEKMPAETKGSHSFEEKMIRINKDKIHSLGSTLVHEIQHAIQSLEGFAKGGNTESVATRAQTFREDVYPLHNMMLDTPEWAEKQRLLSRWLAEEDKAEPDRAYQMQLQERIDEIDSSGVLKGIENKQAELIKKYGYDRNVINIINEPYSEDAEIWDNLPGDFYDRYESYRRLAGEVESRNVQERMGMSPEQRRNKLAEETEDVRREDQIFIEENLGVSASEAAEKDIPLDEVKSQPLTFAEKITNSVLEASAKNKENLALRSDALRMFGRDVANVLKLMGKQREYDKSTVDQLVKLAKMYFKDAQLLGGLTPYQVGRVMTRLNNAVGKRDITDDANELVNILVDAHNKELEKMLEKQAKTKAKKVNASGVEVIGKLDKEGQLLLEEYNNSKVLDLETIDEKILDLQNEAADASGNVEGESGEPDAERTREVAARLRGLELAREYREEILKKRDEIKGLEQELKSAEQDAKDGAMDRTAYKEFRRATERAILESKLEMVDAYHGLIHGLSGDISSSAKRAKLFQQAQIDHVKEIQHNANSDLLGHPAEAQGETPDKWNSSVPRLFMSAMPTFQTMLKFFGEKAADGRGYLYERFIPQHTQASHNEYIGKTEAREKMRDKLTEIFGKKTTIENFMDMSRKDGAVLEYQEGGQKKAINLTKGQVLYLYMINKMADGQMKLSRMGITDVDVQKMAKELPEEMVRFADWVQEDFLTELRDKYNAVHERMFGAPMAAIESYFPIKINKRSRGEKIEPGMNVEDKPSTVTGSVIKRTKNAVAIDLSADAMQVLLGHIDDMENWAAWAEFRRDVKSLLNYRHFQNQVKGMESLRYGSGEKLWKNFVDVANIAAGSFKPSSTAADRAVRNIAKGVVSSKIAFRLYTAAKQILSAPAFWTEVDFDKMVHAYTHQREAWKWAKENLPGFTNRWEGRAAGNEILLESDKDWKVWKNRFVEGASKWGMTPNAAIDALTVAVGAKAVYETKYEMFKKAGYSEERAKEKALNRAAEAYNESQQSSEGAYLSPLQAEATWLSSVLTAYRNSSFGYNRKMATAIANLKKKTKKGFKQESIEYMTKQLIRDGLTEEQALKFAKSVYRRSVARDAADVAQFGFLLNFVWALGGGAIYLFGGDDEEEKKEILLEAALDGATSGIAQLPAGEAMTRALKSAIAGEGIMLDLPKAVAAQDLETIVQLLDTDVVRAAGEVLNILVAMGVGVNPQTFTDMFVALADTEDFSPREIAMLVLRLINAPNSKLELLEADEAMENYGANIEEITREYAEYQKSKRAPLTGWLYSDESEQNAIERYETRFRKILDERFEVVVENTGEYDAFYENADPLTKEKLAKLRQKFLEGDKETTMEKLDSIDVTKKVLFGSGYDKVNTVYYELSTAEDEDMALMIDQKLKELKPMMDEYKKLTGDDKKTYREKNLEDIRLYYKLNGHKNDVNTLKGVMKKKPEKAQEKMDVIRKLRTKAVELINNYNE